MSHQSGVFRGLDVALLSIQWTLLACLTAWCAVILVLTFSPKDGLLIAMLLCAAVHFIFSPSIAAVTFVAGVTLGRAARIIFYGAGSKARDNARKSTVEFGGGRGELRAFLAGLVVFLAFASLWHLDLSNGLYHVPRWRGIWNNPNTFGMLMGTGAALAMGLAWAGRREHGDQLQTRSATQWLSRAIAFLVGAMTATGLLFSYSRGAWLGAIVALLYLANAFGKLKWRLVGAGVLLVVVLAGLFWHTPRTAPWYFQRLDLSRGSVEHRIAAWRAGFEIMCRYPFGVGWGKTVETYQRDYSPPKDGAAAINTNDYLMLGTQAGVPALICFAAYMVMSFWRGALAFRLPGKARRILPTPTFGTPALRCACRAGAMVLLVEFWFDGGLFTLATGALFWILLELGSSDEDRIEKTRPVPAIEDGNRGRDVKSKAAGFTLIELLIVIAIIAILAALLFPVLNRAREKAQAVSCLNNLRQLSAACGIYSDDNHGELVSCWPIGWDAYPVNPYSWCPGWASLQEPQDAMDGSYGPSPQFDCTNDYALEQGAIWQYVKTAAVYRCPSDNRTLGGRLVVRSYSMNSWMSGRSHGDPTGTTTFRTPDQDGSMTYVFFRTEDQIRQPSQTWRLIDEDASTINDSMFIVDMSEEQNNIPDLPSTRHGGAFELAFSDGHAASSKWLASPRDWQNDNAPDADWVKLKSLTTVKK